MDFRRLQKEDWEFFRESHMSDEVMKFITGRALSESESKIKFEEKLKDEAGTLIILSDNDKIGTAKFQTSDQYEVEVGYILHPQYWHKCYGLRAATLLVEMANLDSSLKVISAVVDPENIPSVKILKKLNFKFYESKIFDGLPGDIYKRYTDRIATTGSKREAV